MGGPWCAASPTSASTRAGAPLSQADGGRARVRRTTLRAAVKPLSRPIADRRSVRRRRARRAARVRARQSEPDRGVEQASVAAGASRRPTLELPELSGGGKLARRLPRQGRRPQLLGLLVRALPRRVAAARALAQAARARSAARCSASTSTTSPATPSASSREYGLTYPMLRDGDGDIRDELGIVGLPETFVDRPPGPHRRRRARPRRRALHARARRCRCCRSAREARAPLLAALLLAALAPPAVAADCPKTSLGDVEDEVMCPICGTPLGLADRGPAGPARARLHPAPDRRLQVQGADQARAGRPVRRARAGPARRRRQGLRHRRLHRPGAGDRRWPAGGIACRAHALAPRPARGRPHRDPPPAGADAARLDADLERYDL